MGKFKTRLIGIVIAATVLFSGATILAVRPQGNLETMDSAAAMSYGDTVHVDLSADELGEWYSFTAPATATVCIYASNKTAGDPCARLYGSDQNHIAMNDDGGNENCFEINYEVTAGQTYYIWASKFSETSHTSYDMTISWGGTVAQNIYVDGNPNGSDYYQIPSGADPEIELHVSPPGDSQYTYKWYRYSYVTGDWEIINGLTSNSLEDAYDLGDHFACGITKDGLERKVTFVLEKRDYVDPGIDGDCISLSDSGSVTTAVAPAVDGDGEYGYIASLNYLDHSGEGWGQYASDTTTVTIPPFNRTTLDTVFAFEQYHRPELPNPGYTEPDQARLFAFVRTETNSGTIEVDYTNTLGLPRVTYADGEFTGIVDSEGLTYSECVVYSFTPELSGTYTFASSNIRLGDPFAALFDSDYSLISYCDNNDGSFFYDNPSDSVDRNFTVTEHLTGGQTYYYVAWSSKLIPITSPESSSDLYAAYDIALTCDELDSYNVTVTSGGHGTASASVSSGVPGTSVTLTATPASGYRFASWTVVSGGVSVSNNRFVIGNSNVEIRANFEQIPSTPTPAPTTTPSEGGVAGFVERLYTIALGRPSEPAGKQDWINAITLRGETGAGAARGFLFSHEFLNKQVSNGDFVRTLYRTFFDREPDQAGYEAWVRVLDNGGSKESVIEGFINSTEWANLCLFYGIRSGGTGTPNITVEPNAQTIAFARRLYTTCLCRNADENGMMAWARQLANQRDTGSGAAHGFFFSEEFGRQNVNNRDFVTRLYRTFMGREPDQAGFNAWVAQLDEGVSREEVFNGFANSVEFARICASYGIIR